MANNSAPLCLWSRRDHWNILSEKWRRKISRFIHSDPNMDKNDLFWVVVMMNACYTCSIGNYFHRYHVCYLFLVTNCDMREAYLLSPFYTPGNWDAEVKGLGHNQKSLKGMFTCWLPILSLWGPLPAPALVLHINMYLVHFLPGGRFNCISFWNWCLKLVFIKDGRFTE